MNEVKQLKQREIKNTWFQNCNEKKRVLRLFLMIAVDKEDFMYSGNMFHTSGAAWEKDLPQKVF